MKRIATLTLLCSLILVATAAAQGPLRLAVSDCGGAETATWACDSNTGPALTVVGSIVIPDGVAITEFSGQRSRLKIGFLQAVPAWWWFGTGDCRPAGAMTVDYTAMGTTCGLRMGDLGSVIGARHYDVGPSTDFNDTVAQLDLESALQEVLTWSPTAGQELGLFTLTIGRANTTGAGACEGCTDCVNLFLDRVTLTQPVGLGDYTFGSFGEQGAIVGGQGHIYDCIVPTNRTTWGQVKSMYR